MACEDLSLGSGAASEELNYLTVLYDNIIKNDEVAGWVKLITKEKSFKNMVKMLEDVEDEQILKVFNNIYHYDYEILINKILNGRSNDHNGFNILEIMVIYEKEHLIDWINEKFNKEIIEYRDRKYVNYGFIRRVLLHSDTYGNQLYHLALPTNNIKLIKSVIKLTTTTIPLTFQLQKVNLEKMSAYFLCLLQSNLDTIMFVTEELIKEGCDHMIEVYVHNGWNVFRFLLEAEQKQKLSALVSFWKQVLLKYENNMERDYNFINNWIKSITKEMPK